VKAVDEAVMKAADTHRKGILDWTADPLVSSHIVGKPHSSIFDALSTRNLGDGFVRVLSWYDDEWGYSNRVVDLMNRSVAPG